jgi:hypothetical protein
MHFKAPRIYEYFHGTASRVDAVSFTTNNMKNILWCRLYFTVYRHINNLYALDAR